MEGRRRDNTLMRALLERCLVALQKRRLLLAIACLIAAATAIVIAPRVPLTWSSELVLQLRKSLATATSEDAGMDPTETDGKITEDYREVQTELLQSEMLHRAVAARMYDAGMAAPQSAFSSLLALLHGPDRRSRAETIDDLTASVASAIAVRRPLKSPIVTVQGTHSSPEDAQQLLRILVEEYDRALHQLYGVDPILRAATEQARAADSALAAADAERETLLCEAGTHDPSAELEVAAVQLAELEKQLALRQSSSAEATARAAAMRAEEAPCAAGFPSEPTRLENKRHVTLLNQLEVARRRVVESPFLETSPEYEALLAPVQQLELELADEPAFLTEHNPPLPNTAAAHYEIERRKAAADAVAELEAARAMAQQVAGQRARVAALQAAALRHERLRDTILRLTSEANDKHTIEYRVRRVSEMQGASHLWSYKMIQEPTRPTRPKRPGRRLVLAALFAAGCFLGLAVTLTVGLFDPSVTSAAVVEHCTGAPPLASLPHLGSRRAMRVLAARLAAPVSRRAVAALPQFADFGAVGRMVESRLDGLLRAALAKAGDAQPIVILVCAPHARAGTTTLALNLALRLRHRVDGAVRLLRLDRTPGEDLPELAGVEVVASRGWIASATNGAAAVIVDAPPVLESDAALEVCRKATACFLIARGDVTRRSALTEAAGQLLAVAEGPVGVVLNSLDLRLPALLQAV